MGLVIPHYPSLGVPHIKKKKKKQKKNFLLIFGKSLIFLNKFKKIIFSTTLKEPDGILNKRGRGCI